MITTLAEAKIFLSPIAGIGNSIAIEGLHMCELYLIDHPELMAAAKNRVMGRG